jgi:hypothetical protein
VQFPLDEQGGEGYGWVVMSVEPGRRVRASAGGTPGLGHNNVITWWMDDDLLFIASSNDRAYRAEDVVPHLRRIAFGEEIRLPPQVVAVEPGRLAGYAGRYQLPEGGALLVAASGDRLTVSPEGQAAYELLFPQGLPGQSEEIQALQAAALNYLEHGRHPELDSWRASLRASLGEFKRYQVMGLAAPDGGRERWTYVSLEHERGSALIRLIVSPEGALQALLLNAAPPALTVFPRSPTEFVPFALGAPSAVEGLRFTNDGAGTPTVHVTSSRGETTAARLTP